MLEGWTETPTDKGKIYSMEVDVKPYHSVADGKMYTYGRIQVTVDKAWVGLKAKIIVSKEDT
jgi:hypothetical protein